MMGVVVYRQKESEEFERHPALDYSSGAEQQGMRNDDWEDRKKERKGGRMNGRGWLVSPLCTAICKPESVN